MTLPLSGPLEASDINVELGRSATATFSIKDAATGVYGAINTCSPYYPNSSAPHAYSEWYGYDHNAVCLNSLYAMTDGGMSTSQGMLYSNSLSYSSTVSTVKPSPRDTFTVSFWIKRATDDSAVGYLFGLDGGSTTDSLIIYWDSTEDPNDPGVYANRIVVYYNDAGGGYMQSVVNLSDSNNTIITGVTPDFWGTANQGNVDANEYSLITIVFDYASWYTNDYATWYWNDNKMTVPWNAGAVGFQDSYTNGDTVTTPDWTNSVLYIGGSVPTELSSGCQLDGYAVYLTSALTTGEVSTIYNGGAVASLSDYQNISNDLIYYNFESDSPSLGEDTGGNYGMFLDELGSPQRIADPAA